MKIHIDLDCFFVSAERTRDKSLCNRPVGIGGRSDQKIFGQSSSQQTLNLQSRGAFAATFFHKHESGGEGLASFIDPDGRIRGILTTASYEARRYGIGTGTTIREALQRCPDLIVKTPDMQLYQRLSRELRAFLQERIPVIEQASIDEFYGDLSGWVADREVPRFIDTLRLEIMHHLDLPVSIGAAGTKSIAKLATSSAKPFGTKTVYPHELQAFLEPIPVAEFPGIGRAMQRRMRTFGIKTLGELLRSRGMVESWGPYARELYRRVSGDENTEIVPDPVRKSIGISRTFDPVYDRAELRRRIVILARHLSFAVMRIGVLPTTFRVSVGYDYSQHAHADITQNRLFSEQWFKELSLSLFEQADRHKRLQVIRLGISCSHFTVNSRRELSLLHFQEDSKMRALSEKSAHARDKYGLDILRWGSELNCK
jgi:DNA polymerase-4